MKKRWIALDADKLIFECAEGKYIKENTFDNEKVKLKPHMERFEQLVKDTEDRISADMLGKCKIKGIKVFFSDPDTNFRYDIYPEYKANRHASDRSPLFYRLRKKLLKKYGYVKNTEADDVVAYYVREKNYIGASFDKDLLYGVAGDWFDTYFARQYMIETTKLQSDRFNLIQTLMGDKEDNIKGLPIDPKYDMIPMNPLPEGRTRQPFKVTEKVAIEMLDGYGWDWAGIVKAYKSKGKTEEQALLTRRLTDMTQWSPKKGIRLIKL